jgi:hypothetical protein
MREATGALTAREASSSPGVHSILLRQPRENFAGRLSNLGLQPALPRTAHLPDPAFLSFHCGWAKVNAAK